MKSKKITGKKIIYLAVALVLMVAVCSCQATPPKDVIINKNDGKLEEKILESQTYTADNEPINEVAQEPVSAEPLDNKSQRKITSGEKWVDEQETQKGAKLHINADILLPPSTSLPVAKAKTIGFSNDQVQKVINAIGGTAYASNDTNTTKEAIEERIIEVQQQIAKNPASEWLPQLLQGMEAIHPSAPTMDEWRKSRIEFDIDSLNTEYGVMLLDNGGNTPVALVVSDNSSNADMGYSCYMQYETSGLRSWSAVIYENLESKMNLSKDVAVDTAKKFIFDMGVSGMEVAEIGVSTQNDISANSALETEQCYSVVFTRVLNDVPTIYITNIEWKNNLFENPDMDSYRANWVPESIIVQVNDSGVVAMRWEDPVEITEVETESINIMSIDEAKSKFAENMRLMMSDPSASAGWEQSAEIWIDKVRLGMYFIPLKDNYDSYRMVPCWAFYGRDSRTPENKKAEHDYLGKAQLVFNAVDGSLV